MKLFTLLAASLPIVFCFDEISVFREPNKVDAAGFISPINLMTRHLSLFVMVSLNVFILVDVHISCGVPVVVQIYLQVGQTLSLQ